MNGWRAPPAGSSRSRSARDSRTRAHPSVPEPSQRRGALPPVFAKGHKGLVTPRDRNFPVHLNPGEWLMDMGLRAFADGSWAGRVRATTGLLVARGSPNVWARLSSAVPLLLLACGACTPTVRGGGPEPALIRRASAEYVFYDVVGDTPAAVWASMRAASVQTLGGRYFARTEWNVSWRARWGGGGACRASVADLHLTARVTLPRWVPPAGASAELIAQWDAFIRALSLHEAKHVDIATAGARAIRREIEAVSGPSCAGMDARTRAAAERALIAHREQDRQYDRRTRNGVTEGAVWPPRSTGEPAVEREAATPNSRR